MLKMGKEVKPPLYCEWRGVARINELVQKGTPDITEGGNDLSVSVFMDMPL